ncbi:helix-turn-helix transcriptional regulator [Microbacterium betulae]|uniref:Helix-turn-helix transcriptional regulator n=1 Tax=Microbacterium betulae TaxID=2981139 RepID=A0AA97I525_9MICO|nr:helix-turn-helix transcriptional regulator [Microbacterium sp. AB]WOF23236.1 helix-turn-helix transcriptional regulator [Microbacterium sp. AB]
MSSAAASDRGEPPYSATPWAAYAKELGLAIQRRRRQLTLTQVDVASRANVTRSFYQQIEMGRLTSGEPANPSIWVLVSIAQALDVAVDDLLPHGWLIDPAERRAS